MLVSPLPSGLTSASALVAASLITTRPSGVQPASRPWTSSRAFLPDSGITHTFSSTIEPLPSSVWRSNAMRRPSGDHLGFPSANGAPRVKMPAPTGHRLPPSGSIVNSLGASLHLGVHERPSDAKTMRPFCAREGRGCGGRQRERRDQDRQDEAEAEHQRLIVGRTAEPC